MNGRSFRRVSEQQELPGSIRRAFKLDDDTPSLQNDKFAALRQQGEQYRSQIRSDISRVGGIKNTMVNEPRIASWMLPKSAESYSAPQMRYDNQMSAEENYRNWSQYDSGKGSVRRVSEGTFEESAIRPNPAHYQSMAPIDPRTFNFVNIDKHEMEGYRVRGASIFDPGMQRMASEALVHDVMRQEQMKERKKHAERRQAEWESQRKHVLRQTRELEERASPLVAMGRVNRITRTANETTNHDNKFGMMDWGELARREEMRHTTAKENMQRKASIKAKDHKIGSVRDAEWEMQKLVEIATGPATYNNAYGNNPGYGGGYQEPMQRPNYNTNYGRQQGNGYAPQHGGYSPMMGGIKPVGRVQSSYQGMGGSAIDNLLRAQFPNEF